MRIGTENWGAVILLRSLFDNAPHISFYAGPIQSPAQGTIPFRFYRSWSPRWPVRIGTIRSPLRRLDGFHLEYGWGFRRRHSMIWLPWRKRP